MLCSVVLFGNDHAGYELKTQLYNFMKNKCEELIDLGSYNTIPLDYPIISHTVSERLTDIPGQFGVLICGTGQGMSMAANKHPHIRAGVAWNKEIASMMREHNNANILCLPARHLTYEEAKEILIAFLTTPFSKEERHARRVNQI
jgi:ribose 5-phosphate isomerase B